MGYPGSSTYGRTPAPRPIRGDQGLRPRENDGYRRNTQGGLYGPLFLLLCRRIGALKFSGRQVSFVKQGMDIGSPIFSGARRIDGSATRKGTPRFPNYNEITYRWFETVLFPSGKFPLARTFSRQGGHTSSSRNRGLTGGRRTGNSGRWIKPVIDH